MENKTILDYKQIGKQIKIARITVGVTQEYLAEKLSISSVHMSNIERGTTKVGLAVIVGISKILGVSLDVLLCNEVGTPCQRTILNNNIAKLLDNCSARELLVITDIVESTITALHRVYADDN